MPTTDRLEEALARGRAGEISLDEVLVELADTDLYLPIDDSTSFRRQRTDDGRSFVPAFSTLVQFRQVEPDTPYLVAAGRDLAASWEPDLWMYVNPEGRTPLMLRADKVGLLARQPLPEPATPTETQSSSAQPGAPVSVRTVNAPSPTSVPEPQAPPSPYAPPASLTPPAEPTPGPPPRPAPRPYPSPAPRQEFEPTNAPAYDPVPDLAGPAPRATSRIVVDVQSPRTPPPDAVVATVRQVRHWHPEIGEAYLFEAHDGQRGPRLVAGLVPATGAIDDVRAAVVELIQQLPPGYPVEVMAIDHGLRDVVASSVPPVI